MRYIDMRNIETYYCSECEHKWGVFIPVWETPSCPKCGEHLTVTETTESKKY